ncbi:hypothetical protein EJA72_04885 [Pseudomonas sp. PB120]|nr:hypothetical protein [Pseudomonas sp. PB120]
MTASAWRCRRTSTRASAIRADSHQGTLWQRNHQAPLWRGSLLPLGREAAPKRRTASQSSGSELPRHKSRLQSCPQKPATQTPCSNLQIQ